MFDDDDFKGFLGIACEGHTHTHTHARTLTTLQANTDSRIDASKVSGRGEL